MRKLIISFNPFIMSFVIGTTIASILIPERPIPPSAAQNENLDTNSQQSINERQAPAKPVTYEWEESFSNETEIGRRRKNKVEIRCVNRNYRAEAEVEFYSLSATHQWARKQSLRFENLNYAGCDPQISDFNNDGYKDLTFISGQAARGSNEIQTLLIYDSKKDELIHIKNSAEYPNLAYNKKLDCIDAWLIHGATTTVFLELNGNRLEPFARVHTGLDLMVEFLDVKGKWHHLVVKRMKAEEVFTRYSDFLPLIPHK